MHQLGLTGAARLQEHLETEVEDGRRHQGYAVGGGYHEALANSTSSGSDKVESHLRLARSVLACGGSSVVGEAR